MVEDLTDEKSVKEMEDKELLALHEFKKDLRKVLNLEGGAGVRVLASILKRGGLFKNSFTGNSTTFFNCGMQNVAQSLLDDISKCSPDKLRAVISATLEQ
jgi:hypothetical protein